jgi:hypothetical protein
VHWTATHNAAIFRHIKRCSHTQADAPILLFFFASYVYNALALYSQNDIKKATGLPVSTIRRSLERLALDGFLLAKLKSHSGPELFPPSEIKNATAQLAYALNPAFVYQLRAYERKRKKHE